MDFNAGLIGVLVATKLVYVATFPLSCVSSGFVVALSRHWLCLYNFWLLILHCHDKVAKCHDIHVILCFHSLL